MTKQEKIIKEELQEAQYIGEDGGMVIAHNFTIQEAYQKMRHRVLQDAEEDMNDFASLDDLGIAWLHLTTEENKHKYDDTDWYISTKDESPYEVWVYWG